LLFNQTLDLKSLISSFLYSFMADSSCAFCSNQRPALLAGPEDEGLGAGTEEQETPQVSVWRPVRREREREREREKKKKREIECVCVCVV
jgi:hypothetical protein